MLISLGVVLLTLAAIFAERTAIAAVFAVGGIALPVLGVLLPRVEGQLEVGASGFKMFLSEIEKETTGLSAEAKAEVLELVLEQAQDAQRANEPKATRDLARAIVSTATGGLEVERAFTEWLHDEGWTSASEQRVRDEIWDAAAGALFDVVARKDDNVLVAEVRYRLAGREWSRRLRELRETREIAHSRFGPGTRFVVALAEIPTDGVITRLQEMEIETYVQREQSFERIV